MNRVILIGRLTRDPDIRYSQNDSQNATARYTLAVDRPVSRNGQGQETQTADFIGCVAFGRSAEFAQKYLHKGIKIAVEGHIRTGSYTNKDGQTVYTTDVVVDRHEFCESKNAQSSGFGGDFGGSYGSSQPAPAPQDEGGFVNVPDGVDEDLPFG